MNRRDALILALPVVGMAALTAVPPLVDGPTLCPVALMTGVPCPGCGMTRAVSHLVNGDLASAMSFHPLVLPVVLLGIVGWVWFLLRRLGYVRPVPTLLLNSVLATTTAALVTVWVVRLVSGTLPPV